MRYNGHARSYNGRSRRYNGSGYTRFLGADTIDMEEGMTEEEMRVTPAPTPASAPMTRNTKLALAGAGILALFVLMKT
jgi:hypothetical protein